MSTSPRSEVLHIDAVKPYWRNPRKIPDEAVNAVRESLEAFGYVQPIVVDTENVIIIGHTRYTAMRRIGVTEVEVLRADHLTPNKVKQLRVIDNRVHENAWWDYDLLRTELAEAGSDFTQSLFPEAVAPSDDGGSVEGLDLEAEWDATAHQERPTEFICPSCFYEWKHVVGVDEVQAGHIKTENAEA